MLLEDATSKEEVAAALEAGDEELSTDIAHKLDDAMRWWDHGGLQSHVFEDEEPIDFSDVALRDDFIDEVIKQSPARYELANIPRDSVAMNVHWAATHPKTRSRRDQYGPFYISDGGSTFSFKVYTQEDARFPEHQLPENAEFIPAELAQEFRESLDGGITWDQTDSVGENTGTREGEVRFIAADDHEFDEWCRDAISSYIDNVIIKREPQAAIELFWRGLANESPKLVERFKASNPPDDDILDFAHRFYSDPEAADDIVATIKDYLTSIETGVDEPRTVIGEWTQADLRAMGISKGPLYEEAPWKLIKLHPADLRLEGALMRHCVGDAGMGYVKAMADGDVELWSLRSRANKPRFTLEVDPCFYGDYTKVPLKDGGRPTLEQDRMYRGACIKQIKGKANRTPGFADVHATTVKFPDEVIFWEHTLQQLGADPEAVWDYIGEERTAVQPNAGAECIGFDMPYRPLQ